MTAVAVVALLGAESTGKTTLAHALGEGLAGRGWKVTVVDEFLREFCHERGRTPLQSEQAAIAAEQTRRIEAARATADVVVADTTALLIAVYSDLVFADASLYPSALAAQRGLDLTLLTALDLPWQDDGHQRTGDHVRAPVDALLRAALERAGIAWRIAEGRGGERVASALAAVDAGLPALAATPPAPAPRRR